MADTLWRRHQTANAWVTAVSRKGSTVTKDEQTFNMRLKNNRRYIASFTICNKTFQLQVKSLSITLICGFLFVTFFVGNTCSGSKNVLINNSIFLQLCFVCIYSREAGHSSCRKPSLCLWLEEEKVNTAKIKMDLRLGGPSNTVQQGQTQLRCQVNFYLLLTSVSGTSERYI